MAIARGDLFPQTQTVNGSYLREAIPTAAPGSGGGGNVQHLHRQHQPRLQPGLGTGFLGAVPPAVLAAKANLDASVENYDATLVTLLGDVSQYYVMMRETQERIELARHNVELQTDILKLVQAKLKAGTVTELDVAQQETTLYQTAATIPAFEVTLRQDQDQLCTLLGIPPTDLQARLGRRPIPTAPAEVALGIPAQLILRVPTVRSAERAAAAQAQQIGIAEAALYPLVSVTGTLGYSAQNASQLFTPAAFSGSVGPTFTWNILNYGRIINNVRLQDAIFQQLLLDYRTAVLTANQQAEDGLIAFLKYQEAARKQAESVVAANKAYQIVVSQYSAGTVAFNTVAVIETNLVQAEDLDAQARGSIALGLVQLYRALGGGWEIRLARPMVPQGGPQPGPAPTGVQFVPVPIPLPPVTPEVKPGDAQPQGPILPPPPRAT